MAVDDHGDGGIVVLEAGKAFFPEFPEERRSQRRMDRRKRGQGLKGSGTNLGPMCPFRSDMAKSMCMRVTSAGRTAAPGPHFRLMSCGRSRQQGHTGEEGAEMECRRTTYSLRRFVSRDDIRIF